MFIKSLNPFFALAIYVSVLSGALLFPYNFSYPKSYIKPEVRWLSYTNGIEISSPSVIKSIVPPKKLYDSIVTGEGLTIDVWLSTGNTMQHGPARIISYSYNKYLRNFTLGQDGTNLVLRLRTTNTGLNGQPELVARNIFYANNGMHIVAIYDFEHEIVYVNGKKQMCKEFHAGKFANWDKSYNLAIGNELTGNRPWLGKIYKVAIYNRALSRQEVLRNYKVGSGFLPNDALRGRCVSDGLVAHYLFDERSGDLIKDQSALTPAIDLHISEKLEVTNKIFLRTPYQDYYFDFGTIKDLVVNILGFIPLGFLLFKILRSKYKFFLNSIVIVLIVGILYTFSIESLQYFLESRVSTMTDIVHNNIGIALGIVAARMRGRKTGRE